MLSIEKLEDEKVPLGCPVVACENASIGLIASQATFVKNLNFRCPPGGLTMILGQVASGKSSLLLGLLHEYDLMEGRISISPSQTKIAYAAQDPCLQSNLSTRDNVLFGSQYDKTRYQETLKACAMEQDLANTAKGDLVSASGLSGGQRAVSLKWGSSHLLIIESIRG